MKQVNISEQLLQRPEEQEELLHQLHQKRAPHEIQLGFCQAPLSAELFLKEALHSALNGNFDEQLLSTWFSFYAELIAEHFHPLKRNALLLDIQLIKKELTAYLKGIAQLKEASEAVQKVVCGFNSSAYEVVVAAFLKLSDIAVAHYPFPIDWEQMNEMEKLRLNADFQAFKSIHPNCIIFVRNSFNQEPKGKKVYLFGTGNVGSAFLNAVVAPLQKEGKVNVQLAGIGNSRYFSCSKQLGLDCSTWEEQLLAGQQNRDNAYHKYVLKYAPKGSVIVDASASEFVATLYIEWINAGFNVVTCNKIFSSGDAHAVRHLKQLAQQKGLGFFYETTVGAALPVLKSIEDLVKNGDEIHSISGVLSGTLSYLFNAYNGSKPFVELVKEAQELGYAEPDPRADLSGFDVMKKLVILSREAEKKASLSEIQQQTIVTEKLMQLPDVADFMVQLEKEEQRFAEQFQRAKSEGKVLRYVAEWKADKLNVGIKEVDEEHPFFALKGTENSVVIFSKRYSTYPLVIKGPGAGAEITASGLFTDVLRAAV